MSIRLEHLVKRYGDHTVVHDVSVDVAEGELFVLLGPSGSGKSTVLRMIAGLTDADVGKVLLHGSDVTRLPPQRRGVGFVFQHYALFRNMTVADNVEFAMRVRRTAAARRGRRRNELLELVGLSGLAERYPDQLSGGQQQRVALARALAHRPEVLLLDEPFGALDARIRADLRNALRDIQRELSVTTLFVTHDQEEAFELADRMGVMHMGRLLEVGPPHELYFRPRTEFVATFLGRANLMVGLAGPEGVRLGPATFPLSTETPGGLGDRRVQVLFRPEDVAVKLTEDALDWPCLGRAVVEESAFHGAVERLRLRLPALRGVRAIAPATPFGADHVLVEASRSQHQARRFPLREGDPAWVGVRRVHALTHPGLSLLLPTDGSEATRFALEHGARLARLAHARVTILGFGLDRLRVDDRLREAREMGGAGFASFDLRALPDEIEDAVAREIARQPYDLVVQARALSGNLDACERLLGRGEHHLLLAAPGSDVPRRVLIAVAVGEPAKADILFAGRFVRHLGAEATVLTVVPKRCSQDQLDARERFLQAAVTTLDRLGVPARSTVRFGQVVEEIEAEIAEAGHDLIVVGAPLSADGGRNVVTGAARDLVRRIEDRSILIVRSSRAAA